MNLKRNKATRPVIKGVFEDDSDEEKEKAKTSNATITEEISEDQLASIKTMADYVARNGIQFEESKCQESLPSFL